MTDENPFTPIRDKDKVRKMEETTTHIINIFYRHDHRRSPSNVSMGRRKEDKFSKQYMDILVHFDSGGKTLKDGVRHISKILGMDPIYRVRYEFQMSLWAIQHGTHQYLLYWNPQKGTCIQTPKDVQYQAVGAFLRDLHGRVDRDLLSQTPNMKNRGDAREM